MIYRANIILKNVIKDISQFKQHILLILLADVLFALFMALNTNDQSWRLYILNGSGLISGVVIFYLYFDWNYKNDILTNSLPVSRTEIIITKYLISFAIVLTGSFIFYFFAAFFNQDAKFHDYFLFTSPTILILLAYYHIFLISSVIFVRYSFNSFLPTIFTGVTLMVVFIILFEKAIIDEGRVIPAAVNVIYFLPMILLSAAFLLKFGIKFFESKDIG
jgi:hypothetical protein